MKRLFFLFSVLALGLAVFGSAQAASVQFGWQQEMPTDPATFYGWKIWQSTTQTGTFTQFGADVQWDGTARTEYTSPSIQVTAPAGQETTYWYKVDAWGKPGTDPALRSGFSNVISVVFDLKAPTIPVVTPAIPAATTASTITLAGTKEANSSIWVNGAEKMALSAGTTWSISMPLSMGANLFSITSKDAAGNTSGAVVVNVTRNPVVIPPGTPSNFRVIIN